MIGIPGRGYRPYPGYTTDKGPYVTRIRSILRWLDWGSPASALVEPDSAAVWIQKWGLVASGWACLDSGYDIPPLDWAPEGTQPWMSFDDDDLNGLAAHGVDVGAEMAGPPEERRFYRYWWSTGCARFRFRDPLTSSLEPGVHDAARFPRVVAPSATEDPGAR